MATLTKAERCEKRVSDFTGWHQRQCSRRFTVTEDGQNWCKQHAPSTVKAKDNARRATIERHSDAIVERNQREARAARILKHVEDCDHEHCKALLTT